MSNPLQSFKDKITQYLQLKFELFRLDFIQKGSSLMGYFVFVLILSIIGGISLLLLSLGLAEWWSALFESRITGYFCAAGFFLLISIIILLSKRSMLRFFTNKMIALLASSHKKDEKDEDDDELSPK